MICFIGALVLGSIVSGLSFNSELSLEEKRSFDAIGYIFDKESTAKSSIGLIGCFYKHKIWMKKKNNKNI